MKQPKVDAKTRKLIEQAIAAHSDGHDITITHLFAEIDGEGVEGISLGLRYALSQRPVDPKKVTRIAVSNQRCASQEWRRTPRAYLQKIRRPTGN
jgi:hypothetical protein